MAPGGRERYAGPLLELIEAHLLLAQVNVQRAAVDVSTPSRFFKFFFELVGGKNKNEWR
jgi:hypothetical protein